MRPEKATKFLGAAIVTASLTTGAPIGSPAVDEYRNSMDSRPSMDFAETIRRDPNFGAKPEP